jgi:hypothetical protein
MDFMCPLKQKKKAKEKAGNKRVGKNHSLWQGKGGAPF